MATAPNVPTRTKLTDKFIEKLTAPPGKRLEVSDTLVRELTVRVGCSGSRSWYVHYRVEGAGANGYKGEQRRMRLGRYPVLSLADAREKARQALEAADGGKDPAAQRASEIEERQTRTFEAVLARFIELHAKQNTKEGRFAKERAERARKVLEAGNGKPRELGRCSAERLLSELVLPRWRGRLIETVSRAEAHELLDVVIEERGAAIAREVRKHLTKMFNWAADRGMIPASPLAGMQRPELGYVARERVLSMDELRRIWDAAGEAAYPFGNMVRLLILTGQRRSEVAELERGWIQSDQRAVEIPAARYKTKRPHVYPLSAPAWAIVETLPVWNGGEFVFTTTSGARPVSGFSKAKAWLDTKLSDQTERAEVEPMAPWTMHDIRRSVATHMARIGVPQEHIERVLGHVVTGVAGTYNRYTYLDEKRAALEKWGRFWTGDHRG